MKPRIARTFLTLMVVAAMSFGMVGQAGAYLAPSDGGMLTCSSGTKVGMTSYGYGTVSHSVNGQFQGSWNNGSAFQYRTSYTSFGTGYWLAWSTGGSIWTTKTSGFCY